jgi:hypothetical protein
MALYLHKEANGQPNEITVIEDLNMVKVDEKGNSWADLQFIDAYTVKAHPAIMDLLVKDAERTWTMDEILKSVE